MLLLLVLVLLLLFLRLLLNASTQGELSTAAAEIFVKSTLAKTYTDADLESLLMDFTPTVVKVVAGKQMRSNAEREAKEKLKHDVKLLSKSEGEIEQIQQERRALRKKMKKEHEKRRREQMSKEQSQSDGIEAAAPKADEGVSTAGDAAPKADAEGPKAEEEKKPEEEAGGASMYGDDEEEAPPPAPERDEEEVSLDDDE